MKIGIIGGGAIGLLFGSYLGRKHDVVYQTKSIAQRKLLERRPIELCLNENYIETAVRSCQDISEDIDVNLIIIAVKQYNLESIKETLMKVNKNSPLLFLQNGLSHLDYIDSLPHYNIFVGSVEHGASKTGDISVRHNGIGGTNVAVVRGDKNKLDFLFKNEIPSFSFQMKTDYKTMLLKKLFVNVLINPLTALANVKNGRIIENPFLQDIQIQLFQELIYLFPEMEGKIEFDDVKNICLNTSKNESSMLKDFREQKVSELEAIVGVLVSKADDENKKIPSIQLLYLLLKGKEWEYRN